MEKYLIELFTNFEKFLTPSYIKIINIIYFLLNIFIGISLIEWGNGLFGTSTTLIIAGITWILLSPFIARIQSELILVLFRIYEVVSKNIQKKLEANQ